MKNNFPYVSIVIPSFNAEFYIERCIHSCLDQKTKYPYEIIICDDFSTDKTISILEFLYSDNPIIRVIKNKENLGVGKTRNNAIKESKGRYIFLLDADDYIHPSTIEIMVIALELSPGYDLVFSDYQYIDDQGQKSATISSLERPIACGQLITKGVFVKHGLYKELRIGEDKEFHQRIYKNAKRLHMPIPFYRYRQHKLSITAKYDQNRTYDLDK